MHRLPGERLIRDRNVANQVFLACCLCGENSGQQVVGAHALQVRRHALTLDGPPELQRPRHVPAPACGEEGYSQKRLHEHVAGQAGRDQLEHLLQRKAVLGAEREDDAVVVGRRLQLKIEGAAKALAECQAPGPVDPRAEGRMDHELHAA